MKSLSCNIYDSRTLLYVHYTSEQFMFRKKLEREGKKEEEITCQAEQRCLSPKTLPSVL